MSEQPSNLDHPSNNASQSGTSAPAAPFSFPLPLPTIRKRTYVRNRKERADFNSNDLIALLTAVIDVNPFAERRGNMHIKWQEVGKRLEGQCKNRTWEVYKNKIPALLDWQDNGAKASKKSALHRELKKTDASVLLVISILLDSVREIRDEEEAKKKDLAIKAKRGRPWREHTRAEDSGPSSQPPTPISPPLQSQAQSPIQPPQPPARPKPPFTFLAPPQPLPESLRKRKHAEMIAADSSGPDNESAAEELGLDADLGPGWDDSEPDSQTRMPSHSGELEPPPQSPAPPQVHAGGSYADITEESRASQRMRLAREVADMAREAALRAEKEGRSAELTLADVLRERISMPTPVPAVGTAPATLADVLMEQMGIRAPTPLVASVPIRGMTRMLADVLRERMQMPTPVPAIGNSAPSAVTTDRETGGQSRTLADVLRERIDMPTPVPTIGIGGGGVTTGAVPTNHEGGEQGRMLADVLRERMDMPTPVPTIGNGGEHVTTSWPTTTREGGEQGRMLADVLRERMEMPTPVPTIGNGTGLPVTSPTTTDRVLGEQTQTLADVLRQRMEMPTPVPTIGNGTELPTTSTVTTERDLGEQR
ncbi:hypothetical protein BU17DRAFT_88018 [Hysterangium stoloniferum]|nr:hypothetical protein BU17DRAFT_88018 [Hysterangium stoloniferum]